MELKYGRWLHVSVYLISKTSKSKESTLHHQQTISPCISTEQRWMIFTSCDGHAEHLRGITQVLTESQWWAVTLDFITRALWEDRPAPCRLDALSAAVIFEVQTEGNECNGCDATERSQASNKRKSLWKTIKDRNWNQSLFYVHLEHEGGWCKTYTRP